MTSGRSFLKTYTVSTVLFYEYGGANFAVTNCMSHFSMFVQTKATVKLANVNTGHAQVIGIFFVIFVTVTLYIRCDQFIIFQVTLPTPSYRMPSNLMLILKKLHLNFLNLFFYPSRLFLDIILLKSKQFRLSSNRYCQCQTSNKQEYCCPKLLCPIKT